MQTRLISRLKKDHITNLNVEFQYKDSRVHSVSGVECDVSKSSVYNCGVSNITLL